METETKQAIKGQIFYEFCLLTRACCYRKQGNREEISLCGKIADYLHNLATCDLDSPFGQTELKNYKRFLENYLEETRITRTAIYFYLVEQKKLLNQLSKCYV